VICDNELGLGYVEGFLPPSGNYLGFSQDLLHQPLETSIPSQPSSLIGSVISQCTYIVVAFSLLLTD